MSPEKQELKAKIALMETEIAMMKKTIEIMPNKKSIDDCNSWEDICEYSCRDPLKLPNVSMYDERHKKHAIADFKLTIINEVKRGDWIPNYDDANQKKWYPWFRKVSSGRSSGFVYSGSRCEYGDTYARLGSRFAFPTKEKAESAGKDFLELYNDLIT